MEGIYNNYAFIINDYYNKNNFFYSIKKTSLRVIPLLFMIFTLIFFTYKSYFIKNLNKDIKYNHQLSKKIKEHYDVD
jgi:hypothetical protein